MTQSFLGATFNAIDVGLRHPSVPKVVRSLVQW